MQKNIKKWAFYCIAFLALCGIVWGIKSFFYNHKVVKNNDYSEKIAVIKPVLKDEKVISSYIGRVDAINNTQIVPYISGYVESIVAKGGQEVQKGDIIIKLQQDEYFAALAAAEAELFSAKADYINAKTQYERMLKAGEKAVSATEMDNSKAAYLAAKGSLAKAEAQKFAAQTNFNYTLIKAPFSGVLGNISPSIGDYISPQSQNLAYLIQYSPIRVVFSLTDKEFLNSLQHNNNASLTVKAQLANGFILPQNGEIKYTSNHIDITTNSIAVYVEFDNPQKLLIPDAYVNILLERQYKNTIMLDKDNLIMRPDGDYVYSVKDGILKLHKINILGEVNNQSVLKNNFASDEFIVIEAVDQRLVGQKVSYKIINTEK